jgi:hypothetical protein
MSDNEYSIPAGAKPWVPDGDTPPDPEKPEKVEDASRKVAGLSVLPAEPQIKPEEDAPTPKEVVSLEDDGADDDKSPAAGPEENQMCLACGSRMTPDMRGIDITEEDKNRWLRHILGEERFRQTYSVFNGRLQITFRSRTTQENDMLFKQMTHEINNNKLPEAPYFSSPAYVARMNRLMTILSLENITKYVKDDKGDVEAHPVAYPFVTEEEYSIKDTEYHTPLAKAHADILTDMDESLVAVIMTLLRRFDVMVSTLVMHSSDADFWTAAGAES